MIPEDYNKHLGYPALHRVFRWTRNLSLYAQGYGCGSRIEKSGEMHVIRMLPHRGIVLDVGAHSGEWTQAVLAERPGIKVFAFEPSYEAMVKLRQKEINASTLQVALSNVNSHGRLQGQGQTAFVGQIGQPIKLRTVDYYGFGPIALMKIDVEGHELKVLQGASDTLKRTRMVQWEMGPRCIDERVFLRDFFYALDGFKIYLLSYRGLIRLKTYDPHDENFLTSNYVAIRKE